MVRVRVRIRVHIGVKIKVGVCVSRVHSRLTWIRIHPTQCGQWIGGVANTWRTVGDVQATWGSVMANIHANDKMASVVNNGQAVKNGQGNFNDADMLGKCV